MPKYSFYYDGTQEMTRAVKVEPINDYKLRLFFSNGEVKIYDVLPSINQGGVFAQLRNPKRFSTVKMVNRVAVWNFIGEPINDIDICSEVLYWDSVSEEEYQKK